jgi:hypothetical protein
MMKDKLQQMSSELDNMADNFEEAISDAVSYATCTVKDEHDIELDVQDFSYEDDELVVNVHIDDQINVCIDNTDVKVKDPNGNFLEVRTWMRDGAENELTVHLKDVSKTTGEIDQLMIDLEIDDIKSLKKRLERLKVFETAMEVFNK